MTMGRAAAMMRQLLAVAVVPVAVSAAAAEPLAAAQTPAAAAAPPPVSAYAELPPIRQAALSPDGSRAVILRAIGDTYQVVLAHLDEGRMELLMAADPERFLFNWCRWANDERIVCSIRSYATMRAAQLAGYQFRRYRDGRTVFTRLLAIDADGSNELQLVPGAVTRPGDDMEWNAPDQDTVVSWLDDDPRHILIQLRRERPDAPTLYRLDIYDNGLSRVRRAHPAVQRWYADRTGRLRLAAGYRDIEPVAFAVHGTRLEESDLTALAGIRPPTVAGLAGSGEGAYVFANHGRDTRGLYRVNLATGEVAETLLEDPDFDVDGELLVHRDSGRALALHYQRDRPAELWFDAALEQRFAALRAAIPGHPAEVRVVSADASLNRLLLVTSGNGTAPRNFLFDLKAGNLVRLGEAYAGLDPFATRRVSYTARDGLTIPAYLTQPDGAGPFPTVLLPHGGPWYRDSGGFDYWTQFLVSRGYAVLQPNFRGSTGYGDRYLGAGFEQWGLAMQTDLVDGLDWLVKQGVADPDRVCVVGGSYGGYAALVAAFKTPERIRCAVSFAGVTDLDDLVERWRSFQLGELSVARVQDGPARRANSPLQQARRISVPLLIVHGDVDRSVMIEQSRAMVDALEEAGKSVRYLEQTNGDHHLSLAPHRVQFLEAMEAFLAEHLGDPEAS